MPGTRPVGCRQGFDPDMLLALLLYAYAVGERSSRRIERLWGPCRVPGGVWPGRPGPHHDRPVPGPAPGRVRGRVRAGAAAVRGRGDGEGRDRVDRWHQDRRERLAGREPPGAAVRHEAQRIAHEIVAEAARVDAAEDARGDDDDLRRVRRPRWSGREHQEGARRARRPGRRTRPGRPGRLARIGDLLARLEAGEALHGPVPAGADPIAWYRARITGLGRSSPSSTASVAEASVARTELRRVAARRTDAGRRRGRGRDRDPRPARSRARGTCPAHPQGPGRGGTGPTVNVSDPESRLMTHGAGGGSVQLQRPGRGHRRPPHPRCPRVPGRQRHPLLRPRPAHRDARRDPVDLQIGTVLADAGYFTEENLTMPGPDRLIAPGKHRDLPTGTDPAPGPPPGDATARELMRDRLRPRGRDDLQAKISHRRDPDRPPQGPRRTPPLQPPRTHRSNRRTQPRSRRGQPPPPAHHRPRHQPNRRPPGRAQSAPPDPPNWS